MPAATSIDGGAIDRIIAEKAGGFRVARLFIVGRGAGPTRLRPCRL